MIKGSDVRECLLKAMRLHGNRTLPHTDVVHLCIASAEVPAWKKERLQEKHYWEKILHFLTLWRCECPAEFMAEDGT
jgi:hypothetical protein